MSFQQEDRVPEFPGQAEEPLPEASRLLIEASVETHVPQAPEGGKEPRPVVEPETQLPSGDVRGFLFARAIPVHLPKAGAKSNANVERLAERLSAIRQL
jgi:hypothetical protein